VQHKNMKLLENVLSYHIYMCLQNSSSRKHK